MAHTGTWPSTRKSPISVMWQPSSPSGHERDLQAARAQTAEVDQEAQP